MSDENEMVDIFDGGFFEDADVDLNNVPDDPFGFGNDFWPVRIVEVGKPKVTGNGDKVGMKIAWAVEHPKYDGHYVSEKMGFGNWMQLPVPKKLQGTIPWNPKENPKDQKVLIDLKNLYAALGFAKDEMGSVNEAKLMNRICMAKIKPKQNEQGFWEFNLFGFKVKGDGDGANEFVPQNPNSGGKTPEQLLEDELNS